jgi:hypothetical protein
MDLACRHDRHCRVRGGRYLNDAVLIRVDLTGSASHCDGAAYPDTSHGTRGG